MKTNNKIHIQCGYEDLCIKRDCMKCGFRIWDYNLRLTLAEQIVIEDFAVCDLQSMINEKPKEVELMQDIMRKIMKKMFKNERKTKELEK